ncbi:Peptidase family M23 [Cohnella sp. OV330]|uniref:M23 family metallopeptidase n=1 Tax=Cohnella sp. OV330 TaxID=1855288 RepID=UPI0008E82032|nr:M23 family metallopeptidase [Cohnella sp. OV330]SFB37203.1 Peptidase family M23 [Cohnella sp. OV330]
MKRYGALNTGGRGLGTFGLVAMTILLASGCGGGQTEKRTAGTAAASEEGAARFGGPELADRLLAGEYERLYAQMDEGMRGAVTLDAFRETGERFTADVAAFRPSSVLTLNGRTQYVWTDDAAAKGLSATVDATGTIVGLRPLTLARHPNTDRMAAGTALLPPFRGQWLVVWGGLNELENYHYAYEAVRYAVDFVKEKDGYSFEGDPALNESYYAYGQDVLAPASGEVIAAVDGIADNAPVGKVNPQQPAGNMVAIRHANGEITTLAHLKKGSVMVKAGDRVAAGQLIGQCGNSGESTEPHLHIQTGGGDEPASAGSIPMNWTGGLELKPGIVVKGGEEEERT